jgi:hypothetical protein
MRKGVKEIFINDIYYKGTVLEKMENLLHMEMQSNEYQRKYESLYQDIIKVGEYDISNIESRKV